MKSKKRRLSLCILLFVILCGSIYCYKAKEPDPPIVVSEKEDADSFSDVKKDETGSEPHPDDITDNVPVTDSPDTGRGLSAELIGVYVCGEVVSPGVYYLAKDSRITDAIELAGGFTENADISAVNLAAYMTDGMKIYVPEPGQMPMEGTDSGGSSIYGGKVNINTAGEAELTSIPGIGKAKAGLIIAYRTEHGAFGDISDIMNISGIKEATYNRIKEYITV